MTERLPEQRERGWRAYIEGSLRLITRLEEDLRPTGLSLADYHVLVVLSEAPDRRLRMGELADRLVFSPSRSLRWRSVAWSGGRAARRTGAAVTRC